MPGSARRGMIWSVSEHLRRDVISLRLPRAASRNRSMSVGSGRVRPCPGQGAPALSLNKRALEIGPSRGCSAAPSDRWTGLRRLEGHRSASSGVAAQTVGRNDVTPCETTQRPYDRQLLGVASHAERGHRRHGRGRRRTRREGQIAEVGHGHVDARGFTGADGLDLAAADQDPAGGQVLHPGSGRERLRNRRSVMASMIPDDAERYVTVEAKYPSCSTQFLTGTVAPVAR